MDVVTIPHFDYPFRFVGGRSAVVQQDSLDDVKNCVIAALKTERGTRAWVPQFGITDPTFEEQPVHLNQMEREINDSEPRAIVDMRQATPPTDTLASRIVVGVKNA